MAMVDTVLGALAPIVVTLLLGFVAAWRHDFGATDASVLNRMVLQYAVPVTLFVGTIGTPRADLIKGLAFAVAICVAIVPKRPARRSIGSRIRLGTNACSASLDLRSLRLHWVRR
jgi:hypothetical protein